MLDIIRKLHFSKIVESLEIMDMVDDQTVKMLKIKVFLKDKSQLFIHEMHTPSYQKYSYHWQAADGSLLSRWDNSPHHKELPNYPYHLHQGNSLMPCYRVSIDDVLKVISERNL